MMKKYSFLLFVFSCLNATAQTTLMGMTKLGGTSNTGTLFEYNVSTSGCVKEVDFTGAPNGSNPNGSLLYSTNGKLYGLTYDGGAFNYGVLFEFNPITSTYTKRLDFNGANGSLPGSAMIEAANGKFYGVTITGGMNNKGILFEYDTTSNTLTDKYDFSTSSGSWPIGAPLQTSSGILYGMTQQGGANGYGVFYKYDPFTNVYTKKFDFDNLGNGRYPSCALIEGTDGLLYGMTNGGGAYGLGTLFTYDTLTSTYSKKLDFSGAPTGTFPVGALMQASNGKMYGLTQGGGTAGMGSLFEYDPIADTLIKKVDLTGSTNGSVPYGTLMESVDGNLYGMTSTGGTSNKGVLFQYNFVTGILTKKVDFSGSANGSSPWNSQLVEIPTPPSSVGIQEEEDQVQITLQPNPNTSQTILSLTKNVNNAIVSVYDVTGRLLRTTHFSGNNFIIEKGAMKAGLYFVTVSEGNSLLAKTKMVVE